MFLEENTEDPADFAADFLPCLLQLATDPVPNIRLLAAKVLMQFSETGEVNVFINVKFFPLRCLFSDSNSCHYTSFHSS